MHVTAEYAIFKEGTNCVFVSTKAHCLSFCNAHMTNREILRSYWRSEQEILYMRGQKQIRNYLDERKTIKFPQSKITFKYLQNLKKNFTAIYKV